MRVSGGGYGKRYRGTDGEGEGFYRLVYCCVGFRLQGGCLLLWLLFPN